MSGFREWLLKELSTEVRELLKNETRASAEWEARSRARPTTTYSSAE